MYKNNSGQVVLPIDQFGESIKLELCRTYCMVAAACPPHSPAASRTSGVMSTKELFKLLLANIRSVATLSGCHSVTRIEYQQSGVE